MAVRSKPNPRDTAARARLRVLGHVEAANWLRYDGFAIITPFLNEQAQDAWLDLITRPDSPIKIVEDDRVPSRSYLIDWA